MASEHKFKSWAVRVVEMYPDDWSKSMKAWHEPDLELFIDHHADEVEKARNTNSWDDRWGELGVAVADARLILEKGSTSEIAAKFYRLGHCVKKVDDIDPGTKVAAMEALLGRMKRETPLALRNVRLQTLKEYAQGLAALRWREDVSHETRLGEMCDEVYSSVAEFAEELGCFDLMPDLGSGLKPWLRPVAPKYARKGGPPKK